MVFPGKRKRFEQSTFLSNEVFKNEFFQLRKMIGNPMAWLYFCYKTNRSYRKKFRNVITSIYRLNCMSAARTGVRFRYINFHHKSLPFPLHHINKIQIITICYHIFTYFHFFIFYFKHLQSQQKEKEVEHTTCISCNFHKVSVNMTNYFDNKVNLHSPYTFSYSCQTIVARYITFSQ